MPRRRAYVPPMIQAPTMGRRLRRPVHTFALKQVPYTIQPFLLAPVIPGETMKNLLLQARAVSDPVLAPLTGWWLEHYFFYVKHRDMQQDGVAAELEQMMLNPEWDPSPVDEAGTAAETKLHYFAGNGINWTKLCLKEVVQHYFRNEGEAWDDHMMEDLPVASVVGNSWLDSVSPDATMEALDVKVPVDATPAPDEVSISDIESGLRQWQLLRFNGLTDQTYEEYLETYGVRQQQAEVHVPELLRYVRSWSYPSNTIDPTDGSAASAVSWSVAERADKDRFFTEPGFIFGVSVARPKIYFANQRGSAAFAMIDAYRWLPAVLQGDHRVSWKNIATTTGPLPTNTDANGYWIDVRDLLMYGDQFVNFLLTDGNYPTDFNVMKDMPTDALSNKRYAKVIADVKALFVTGASAYFIRQDGVVNLAIASRERDNTPGVNRQVLIG